MQRLQSLLGDRAKANEPLARHTTFRIGGPAELWIEARALDELTQWVRLARECDVPVMLLGNGSNILVSDDGIPGLVIENHCNAMVQKTSDSKRLMVHIESGATLPLVANQLARQGWAGLEWAIGVPGTVGGAIVGNAGAHGGSIADRLIRTTVLDWNCSQRDLSKEECNFSYRTSRFKQMRRELVLAGDFELTQDDPQECIARMNKFVEHRRRTQPTEASVGSIFKNPPGDFAGRLIEQAGLKGKRVGNVQVSPVHANFFVNSRGATAHEVMELIDLVRDQVRTKFGVALELEIELVGDRTTSP